MPVRVVTDIGDDHLQDVVGLFAATWWAADRDIDEARAIVRGSAAVVGLVGDGGRLVGFCRAISDGAALAVVLDVIVHPDCRGRGLGDQLMAVVLAQPALQRVRSVELVCQPDLVDFYRRCGFTDRVGRSRLMRRTLDPRLAAVDTDTG